MKIRVRLEVGLLQPDEEHGTLDTLSYIEMCSGLAGGCAPERGVYQIGPDIYIFIRSLTGGTGWQMT